MSSSKEVMEFVEYDMDFLNRSWGWLNDPEIKKLTLTSDFTRSEQLKFFHSIPSRKDFRIWGMKYGHVPIGAVGLKNITSDYAEYFGYIGDKSYWGLGLFKYIFEYIADNCKSMEISVVYLHVTTSNTMAIKAYKKSGFIVTQEESDVFRMELIL